MRVLVRTKSESAMKKQETVGTICSKLSHWFPLDLAGSWDNTGLLLGSSGNKVNKILFCLTITKSVCEEAIERNVDMIVSHHPIMLKPVKKLTDDSHESWIIRRLCKHDISVYCPHTAHDNAIHGINDQLARLLGLENVRPIYPHKRKANTKLVVFVPKNHADSVASAVFYAGGGVIGKYSGCSFRTDGIGTFFGETGSNPAIGVPGTSQSVPEIRLEIIVPNHLVSIAVSEMKSVHPYEEPAYDIIPLAEETANEGEGRFGQLPYPVKLGVIAKHTADILAADMVQCIGDLLKEIKTVAIGCGAAGEWVRICPTIGADLFITGEMKYHDMLLAHQTSTSVLVIGHYASESFSMKTLMKRVESEFPDVEMFQTATDHFVSQWIGRREIFTCPTSD